MCVNVCSFTSVSALWYVPLSLTVCLSVCTPCSIYASYMFVFKCVYVCMHMLTPTVSRTTLMHCFDYGVLLQLPVLCVYFPIYCIIYLAEQMGYEWGIPPYNRTLIKPEMTPTGFSITIPMTIYHLSLWR